MIENNKNIKKIKGRDRKNYYILLRVAFCFMLVLAILLMERVGILYETTKSELTVLAKSNVTAMKSAAGEAYCLMVVDSANEMSCINEPQFTQILTDMRIPFKRLDLSSESIPDDLSGYRTVVLVTPDISGIGQETTDLMEWVADGGRVMIGVPPIKTPELDAISTELGMEEVHKDYYLVDSFKSSNDFMIGNSWTYHIEDAYESSLNVSVSDSAQVYATTEDGRPLIWSMDIGKGRTVVCNFGYCVKAYRGIYASAYTLLEDVTVYPVINGSAYYLDDFPAPVPSGDSQYIQRDYQMSTAQFYSQVWWPDVLALGQKHDAVFTGLVIESYSDDTSGDIKPNKVTSDYNYYGNMLLKQGGEIGYHGFNHQPLCGPDYQYVEDLGYNVWASKDAMKQGFKELERFVGVLFPDSDHQVYVPPSDVLSAEGRKMLSEDFNDVRAIASVYLPSGDGYAQEFEVAEDGIIETPRIISSCVIDNYMELSAFSELNFHYVSTHFMHPDDVLDIDRGADRGWEALCARLDEYMTWLYDSAPSLRRLTGSELAGAVQRYCMVSPIVTETDDAITVSLNGLVDNAYLMVRINDGKPGKVTGGKLSQLNDTLYLLEADSDKVVIERQK